ncbi:hypothetical protein [Cellulomonas sp. Leaf334]|uniref:hypothetical protein n=1 Tax=Cellulomonas sp. Leaf334 TaxID=1736339 RepID=UPI000700EF59|nr:hypothetical protein [Cellulomonas sp. Leaf334]KQR12134.1 hypothetical protein ASF78_13300 [Cellulomonas sp. Leaf334]
MTLEELLRQERDVVPPNPLADRAEEIVARVRRRRRAAAVAAGAVITAVVAVAVVVVGQLLPRAPEPAEPSPSGPVLTLPQTTEGVPIVPGRYVLPVLDAPADWTLEPVVTVPEGFLGLDAGVTSGDFETDDARVLWLWNIDSVFTHPCELGATAAPVGPTVADLAAALAAQPMRAATAPVPVTVGGYEGLYLELSVPDDIDPDACPVGRFSSWEGRWQQVPGQVDLLWIVDVDGQRITVDASLSPGTSPQEAAELTDMVASTRFVPVDDH